MTEIFAHRGSCHSARENTIEAFVAARDLGADGVELDVHLSADGQVVVHHDAELPGFGLISGLDLAQLPEWLPCLSAALDACEPLKVNVEIKSDDESGAGSHDLLAAAVSQLLVRRAQPERFIVSSFSLQAIDAVRLREPSLATALLVDYLADTLGAIATVVRHGHNGLHPFFACVGERLVHAARVSGVALRPWTVDGPDAIGTLASLGVNGVITNDVRAALSVLGRKR
jgi:glycerophosphoryl diester phosphodiesterase